MEEKRRYGRQLEAGAAAAAALECPRCGSRNTKFCYYNNYNTAQPRHFCRECHRYWTQGGALRNIPAPGETSASRKRSRRAGPPTAPGGPSSKVPRIRVDHHQVLPSAGNTGMPGAALAALGMSSPPSPPPPMFFAHEGMGLVGAGFPLRPTLSLFNQGFAGLRGFQPFNHLMMPPPPPPAPSLSLPLLHGLGMNQVLSTVSNAGDGSTSGASGITDDNINASEGGNAQDRGNISGGDSFVNQFFTRFNESDVVGGDQARPALHEFNATAERSSNLSNVSATGTAPTSTATGSPARPASFI